MQVDPEMRIRFTSPHPKDFPDEVHMYVYSTTINIHMYLYILHFIIIRVVFSFAFSELFLCIYLHAVYNESLQYLVS